MLKTTDRATQTKRANESHEKSKNDYLHIHTHEHAHKSPFDTLKRYF